MIKPTKFVWFNGRMVPWNKAKIHVLTHSLHYGTAVFEGIRANKTSRGPAIFRLDAHIERLMDSAKIMQMKTKFSYKDFFNACIKTVKANKLQECYIRPLIFFGFGKMGLGTKGVPVESVVVAWEWATYLGKRAIEKGARAMVSSYTRHHVDVTMTKAKTSGAYANSTLAKNEAVNDGFDEAIMLDPQGYVSECSAENIFLVDKGKIITPPLSNILEGVTRDSILTAAQNEGIKIKEQRITRDQLYSADEVFLTGTAAEVTPITEVDRRKIANGKPGEITKKLQKIFFDASRGRSSRYNNWLIYVE